MTNDLPDYGCALQQEILIQGRIYISENHVASMRTSLNGSLMCVKGHIWCVIFC